MAVSQYIKRLRRAARIAGAACAMLIITGCTAFPMRSQQVWRSLIDYEYPSEEVATPAFEKDLDRATESRATTGNSVLFLDNGDETYPEMLNLIHSARHRISFETYIIENDETTDIFFDALKTAAQRGVEVRVTVDAAGFHRRIIAQLNELSEFGVQARVFNPYVLSWTVLRGNNRNHRKILVADGRHAILGGINISDIQTGDGISGWRDTSLLVSGPAAFDAEMAFAETWEQAGRGIVGKNIPIASLNPIKRVVDEPLIRLRESVSRQAIFIPTPCPEPDEPIQPVRGYHSSDALVRVVASSPDRFNSTTYDLALQSIYGARERIDMAYAYFVPPLSARRAILRAAERGVKVRMLLPGVTDVRLVREIGMKFYGEFLRAGVEIYEWPHPILHSKTMAIDGKWVTVGSTNMDSRSYFLNYEANLAVTDRALAEEAHLRFENDLQVAHRLTLEEWEKRSALQRIQEIVLTPVAGQF